MKPQNKSPASHRKCKMQRKINDQNVTIYYEMYITIHIFVLWHLPALIREILTPSMFETHFY